MIAAYPLQWPAGWPRTRSAEQKGGKFGSRERRPGNSWISYREITIYEACERVLDELGRMGVDRQDIVISTNVRTRLDGMPRSGEREPDDSGAAVYWQDHAGNRRVMGIDVYTKVADNLAAIAATLDAMRAIERHGGARVLERAFTGFTPLPAPTKPDWKSVLGLQGNGRPTLDDIKAAYRRLSSLRHPDKPGGSHAAMVELNAAYAEAQESIGRAA